MMDKDITAPKLYTAGVSIIQVERTIPAPTIKPKAGRKLL